MSELRAKSAVAVCAAKSAVAECAAKSAVAECTGEDDTNDDPMAALDQVVTDTQPTHSTRSGGKRACKSKRGSDAVQTISMPLLPLGKCGGKTVKVRDSPESTSTLWIHRDDVPWLVAYIADEVAFGGVEDTEYPDGETPQEAKAAVAAPNCKTPGLHTRWDFGTGDAWDARWVEGPLVAYQNFKSHVSKLSEEKWNQVRSEHSELGALASATERERKDAVWCLLEMHAARMLAEHEQDGG